MNATYRANQTKFQVKKKRKKSKTFRHENRESKQIAGEREEREGSRVPARKACPSLALIRQLTRVYKMTAVYFG